MGLSSQRILWYGTKLNRELNDKLWQSHEITEDLTKLHLVNARELTCSEGFHTNPPVTQPFPEPFLPPLKTMASCVPMESWGVFSCLGLDTLLNHMVLHMLTARLSASQQVIRHHHKMYREAGMCPLRMDEKKLQLNLIVQLVDNDKEEKKSESKRESLNSLKGHLRRTNCSFLFQPEQSVGDDLVFIFTFYFWSSFSLPLTDHSPFSSFWVFFHIWSF